MQIQITAELDEGYGAKLAYSPRGDSWVSVAPAQFHLWSGTRRSAAVELRGQPTGGVHFSADGRLLYLSPLIFDLEQRAFLPLPPLHESLVAGIPPEQHARHDQFELQGAAWDAQGQQLAVYTQHRPPRRRGANSSYSGPTRRLLLLDGRSRALKHVLWQASSAEEYRQIAFGERLIAAGWRNILLWDAQTGKQVGQLQGHTMNIRDLRFSPDGARLISADWEGRVIVWDLDARQPIANWVAHKGAVHAALFYPLAQAKEPIVATGGDDAQLKLFRLRAGQPEALHTLDLPAAVEGIAFHPQGQQLVAAVSTGKLIVCDVKV